ncbi:MAG: endo-1,4-beta-xylanase [Treponema sp.]|jgi:GH35 family endo-1,4-beta-xylanase|nr:endo-1,4-beta-xylanase [Treponema sp.]
MNITSFSHRQSKVTLHFLKADGSPLTGQKVQINQKRHQFLFGCGGFDAVELAGGNPDGTPLNEKRREFLEDRLDKIFTFNNYTTLPFYWGRYENVEGKPDALRTHAAAKYYADRGIIIKGHPLCWHTVCADWLMKYSNKEILEKQLARIEREVTAFKGSIDKWDVINEVVIMPIFDKYDNAVTRLCRELGQVGIIREVFAAARKANGGAVLLLNDFNTSPDYEKLIDSCLQAGIPIDVIGIQSHQHQGYWGLEKLQDVLARFSRFGLPIHFTENTLISGDLMPAYIEDLNDWKVDTWPSTPEGEERQAREAVEMYETLFAHPAVEAITTWDAVDGKWLGAPSGFLRKDNSPKPVYHELNKRIKDEWWTKESLVTGSDGAVELCGFRGDYTAEANGCKADFTLDGKTEELKIILKNYALRILPQRTPRNTKE